MDDSNLLQKCNLSPRQTRRAPLIIYQMPPSEWRISQPYREYGARTQARQHHAPRCYPLLYSPLNALQKLSSWTTSIWDIGTGLL